jgi:hypothetical protein
VKAKLRYKYGEIRGTRSLLEPYTQKDCEDREEEPEARNNEEARNKHYKIYARRGEGRQNFALSSMLQKNREMD